MKNLESNSQSCNNIKKKYIEFNFELLETSINNNIRENFYPDFCRKENDISIEFQNDRYVWIETLNNNYKCKLDLIIKMSEEKSEYYKKAVFLQKYLDKLFDCFKTSNKLTSIFESDEKKNIFFTLIKEILYDWYIQAVEQIKNSPSFLEKRKKEEEKIKREKKEEKRLLVEEFNREYWEVTDEDISLAKAINKELEKEQ